MYCMRVALRYFTEGHRGVTRWMLTVLNATISPGTGHKREVGTLLTEIHPPRIRQICCDASIQHESRVSHKHTRAL